VKKIYMLVN